MDQEQLKKESLELATQKAAFEKDRLEYSRSKKIGIAALVSAVAVIISGLQVWVSIEQRRLSEAQTVQQYIPHLLNPESRDLALRSLRKYIGDKKVIEIAGDYKATSTLKTLAKSEDKETQKRANEVISEVDTQRGILIKNLFSEKKAERIEAANEILSTWSSDTELVSNLISFTSANLKNGEYNENGIYNAVVILNNLPKNNLRANANQLSTFLKGLNDDVKIGPKTKRLVSKVISKADL
jgi:hypothetical protein